MRSCVVFFTVHPVVLTDNCNAAVNQVDVQGDLLTLGLIALSMVQTGVTRVTLWQINLYAVLWGHFGTEEGGFAAGLADLFQPG